MDKFYDDADGVTQNGQATEMVETTVEAKTAANGTNKSETHPV